jgi:hypothetical protein
MQETDQLDNESTASLLDFCLILHILLPRIARIVYYLRDVAIGCGEQWTSVAR